MVLAGQEIFVVVCNDRLDDGKYEDIVKLVVRCETKVPVIVVSRTGDWAEYLMAMCGGAFDYLVSLGLSTYSWGPSRNHQKCAAWALAARQRRSDMGIKPVMVLLVGEAANNSLQLLQWFNRRGCCCQVAQSYRDAFNLLSHTQFDLVLSQYQLPDRTAFPLLDWLVGSSATLFFSAHVENGFLWLKMLERGKRCVGTATLKSNALIEALAKLLDAEVRS
jgi:CheY-like chemotaxis protein